MPAKKRAAAARAGKAAIITTATTIRLAIVVSEFNSGITFRMLDRAKEQAERLGARTSYVFYVPGAFDMPLAIERLLRKRDVDAVVTLGAVIKGDTRHDDIVAENAARLAADLSLKYGKPVALGITGPGMTLDQAKERAELAPARAVTAAVSMAARLGKLEKSAGGGTMVVIDGYNGRGGGEKKIGREKGEKGYDYNSGSGGSYYQKTGSSGSGGDNTAYNSQN